MTPISIWAAIVKMARSESTVELYNVCFGGLFTADVDVNFVGGGSGYCSGFSIPDNMDKEGGWPLDQSYGIDFFLNDSETEVEAIP